ncbi:MAG: hypothetical protein QOE07_699 [Acidimicrobiaceae bacterium]|jgi:hypothetical protein|nr:hypothetical protein [Acidimicrobiaceae bacterium]MDQ1375929.1 hypothetical protein [Acidimicrobiaceae bacterium]MDQ1399209.1 hypothetical protein [Acidimicrobiaceae bacterium]MDQ1412111.1 hypothetical protein [Acidimicrobiaceae bacterium]MDQ1416501.1 hypothetical protein [Acidimicrobiaceae bacterium]
MPGLSDEAKFWSGKAADAHHNILETIRVSAGRWQAAIAAFLGLYTTVGFVLGPDKIAALPVHGSSATAILVAYTATGALGVAAIVLANLAAQGIPEILTGTPMTGQAYSRLVLSRATTARTLLGWAIGCAAIAGLLALGASTFLLGAGVRAAGHTHARVVSPSGAYCGELLDSAGNLSLRLPTGATVPIAGASISTVGSCPG